MRDESELWLHDGMLRWGGNEKEGGEGGQSNDYPLEKRKMGCTYVRLFDNELSLLIIHKRAILNRNLGFIVSCIGSLFSPMNNQQ